MQPPEAPSKRGGHPARRWQPSFHPATSFDSSGDDTTGSVPLPVRTQKRVMIRDDSGLLLESERSNKMIILPKQQGRRRGHRRLPDDSVLIGTTVESRVASDSKAHLPREGGLFAWRLITAQLSSMPFGKSSHGSKVSASAPLLPETHQAPRRPILRPHHSTQSDMLDMIASGSIMSSKKGSSPPRRHKRSADAIPEHPTDPHHSGHSATDYGYEHIDMRSDHQKEATANKERAKYSVYEGRHHVKRKLRVKPHHCYNGNFYMTEEEIYADSLQPSDRMEPLQSYLKATPIKTTVMPNVESLFGTCVDGRIGSMRVEVLGCVGLARSKPDVCVYVAGTDVAFCSDVIKGYRSPMWPKASSRGCIVPIFHAYARLYVGVFDVKEHKQRENDAFCGRVALDVASLRPHTEYDVTMPLRASTFVYDRKPRGVIRLRFSVHWYSERAAVMSYFTLVQSAGRPLVADTALAIPCADPKTFRNLALTIHGQDLPGKFTKNAFRATMREFNLYMQNARFLLRTLVLDAILYERMYISLYLLAANLFCVYKASVGLVPAIGVGYILLQFYENYQQFVESDAQHFGFAPITWREILAAILNDPALQSGSTAFAPITVEKLARQKKESSTSNGATYSPTAPEAACTGNHHEFPFAVGYAYPKFSVDEALATVAGNPTKSISRLHGRLSVYYSAQEIDHDANSQGSIRQDDDSSEVSDDETVMTESGLNDTMFDMEDLDEDDMNDTGMPQASRSIVHSISNVFDAGTVTIWQRLHPGPPQNSDVLGKKVPPQLHLKRIEMILHKATRGLTYEPVYSMNEPDAEPAQPPGSPPQDARQARLAADKKRKRMVWDEFDKQLGMHSRSANPVTRIASTFLGPLMRIIRVFVFICRIAFNAATWRDPFLSFWIVSTLVVLGIILVVFPWRFFFALVSLFGLGPQNILFRRYLLRKAIDRLAQAQGSNDSEVDPAFADTSESTKDRSPDRPALDSLTDDTTSKRLFQRQRASRSTRRRMEPTGHSDSVLVQVGRPAFRSSHVAVAGKYAPKAVAIPYSRWNKDRFYDWPPDPTVAKATPILLQDRQGMMRMRRRAMGSDAREFNHALTSATRLLHGQDVSIATIGSLVPHLEQLEDDHKKTE